MNTKTKEISLFASLLFVFFALFMVALRPLTVHAASDQPATQQINIKKLVFDTYPPEQKNTGDQMQWDNSSPLAGAGFTAYDVTTEYWTTFDQTAGSRDAKEAAAISAVKGLDVTGKLAFPFPLTNTSGDAIAALPIVSNGKNAVYLFKETTTPAGVNSAKSVPFVLGLPIVNSDGTNKSTVYLYPKNEYKTTNLSFTKYGVGLKADGTADTAKPLAGAQFILKEKDGNYYNTASGKFDATSGNASKFTSGNDGVVSVSNLILKAPGTYEFYEVDSAVSVSGPQGTTNDEKFHFKTNPVVTAKTQRDPQSSVLSVSYDYYDQTLTKQAGKDSAKAYNYLVPNPKKTADISNADIGQVITYRLTQQIPFDISQYDKFELIDTPSSYLGLVSSPADIAASLKVEGSFVPGITLNPTISGNEIHLAFQPYQLAPYAGKTLTLDVQMKILPGADLGSDILNNLSLDNNFRPKGDKTPVRTYGKTFKKIDADTKKPLAGAKFVVQRGNQFMKDTNGSISWVANQSDATVLTSGSDGIVSVKGLAQKNGDQVINYQLVETAAPDGYVISQKNIPFTADDGKVVLEVINKLSGTLPITGGIGLIAFVSTGLVIAGGSVLYYLKRRKETMN